MATVKSNMDVLVLSIPSKFEGVTTADQAAKVITANAATIKAHLAKGESKMVDAAYASWVAVEFNLILPGRKTKDSPDVRWTHEEYANLYDGGKGAVKSVVGAWIALGRALRVLELDPNSDLFRRLRKGVEFGKVKDAVLKCENTVEGKAALQTLVEMYVDETGKKLGIDARIDNGTGETKNAKADASESNGTTAVAITAENVAEELGKFLRALSTEYLPMLDGSSWAQFRLQADAMLKGEDDRRKQLQAAPPKRRPRKSVARKTAEAVAAAS